MGNKLSFISCLSTLHFIRFIFDVLEVFKIASASLFINKIKIETNPQNDLIKPRNYFGEINSVYSTIRIKFSFYYGNFCCRSVIGINSKVAAETSWRTKRQFLLLQSVCLPNNSK